MPYKKSYTRGNVKNAKTNGGVMGSQGKPAKIPASHHQAKPTSRKKFM